MTESRITRMWRVFNMRLMASLQAWEKWLAREALVWKESALPPWSINSTKVLRLSASNLCMHVRCGGFDAVAWASWHAYRVCYLMDPEIFIWRGRKVNAPSSAQLPIEVD